MSRMRGAFAIFAVAVIAAVTSVDIRQDALEILKARGTEAWISNAYYT